MCISFSPKERMWSLRPSSKVESKLELSLPMSTGQNNTASIEWNKYLFWLCSFLFYFIGFIFANIFFIHTLVGIRIVKNTSIFMSTTKGPTKIRVIFESKKYVYIRVTVIAKVRVWFPVKPEFMFRFFFNRLGCLFNCGVHYTLVSVHLPAYFPNCFSKLWVYVCNTFLAFSAVISCVFLPPLPW